MLDGSFLTWLLPCLPISSFPFDVFIIPYLIMIVKGFITKFKHYLFKIMLDNLPYICYNRYIKRR
nr:MAG TPA: hypothetical protein [Caudoviricetes sp.]